MYMVIILQLRKKSAKDEFRQKCVVMGVFQTTAAEYTFITEALWINAQQRHVLHPSPVAENNTDPYKNCAVLCFSH